MAKKIREFSDFTPSHIDFGDGTTTLISFASNQMTVFTFSLLIPDDCVEAFSLGLDELIKKCT